MSESPATSYVSTNLSEGVKLRLGASGITAATPMTIPGLFKSAVSKYPNHTALVYESTGEQWMSVNYSKYEENVLQVAKAFIKLGLEPRTSVGVLAFNCPEWFYSQLATSFAGGVIAGIYTTNSPEAVYHVLSTAGATICVVDDAHQMEKVRSVKDRLPNLKSIIQIHGPFADFFGTEEGYYKWSDIMEMDVSAYETELTSRTAQLAPNECAILIFTSGTVGLPKAVMISHDNITWNTIVTLQKFPNLTYGAETVVSYLPLNHIAAQLLDIFIPLQMGGSVYFADRNALKGSLVKTLRVARPTRFLGVPRVFEKIQEQLSAAERQNSYAFAWVLKKCREVTEDYHMSSIGRTPPSPTIKYWFVQKLLQKYRAALGLDRCPQILVAAAPVTVELKKFFMSYGLKLTEIFGMSETSGTLTYPSHDGVQGSLVSCGDAMNGVELKVLDPDSEGQGEICARSRNIFMGYLNEPEKTAESFVDDGWFSTGDKGFIDEHGNLSISGRLKEILITAGGENIPPAHVEGLIKSELPGLSYVFLVGDRRKFLSCLVSLKTKPDPETSMPTNELLPEAIEWMKSLDLEYTTLSEILEAGPCPTVCNSIQEGIQRSNKKSLSNAHRVHKFAILPHDFSLPTGELGPTLKVKRNVVLDKYKDVIDRLYE